MKFKKFNAREKEIYIQAKIRVYYDMKKNCKKEKVKMKYSEHSADEYFKKALERTYGKTR